MWCGLSLYSENYRRLFICCMYAVLLRNTVALPLSAGRIMMFDCCLSCRAFFFWLGFVGTRRFGCSKNDCSCLVSLVVFSWKCKMAGPTCVIILFVGTDLEVL